MKRKPIDLEEQLLSLVDKAQDLVEEIREAANNVKPTIHAIKTELEKKEPPSPVYAYIKRHPGMATQDIVNAHIYSSYNDRRTKSSLAALRRHKKVVLQDEVWYIAK